MHSMPSKRDATTGYFVASVENLSVASLARYILTFDLRCTGPVRNSPAGTTTRPPPALTQASMAFAIAPELSLAEPDFAPNFVMSKSLFGNVGGLIRPRISVYKVS